MELGGFLSNFYGGPKGIQLPKIEGSSAESSDTDHLVEDSPQKQKV